MASGPCVEPLVAGAGASPGVGVLFSGRLWVQARQALHLLHLLHLPGSSARAHGLPAIECHERPRPF